MFGELYKKTYYLILKQSYSYSSHTDIIMYYAFVKEKAVSTYLKTQLAERERKELGEDWQRHMPQNQCEWCDWERNDSRAEITKLRESF